MDQLRQWSNKYPKADKWLLCPVYIQLDLQFGIFARFASPWLPTPSRFLLLCLLVSSVADGYLVYCTVHH